LHDFGQGPSGPYLVFEMLRGRTLAERLRAGPMPFDEVLDVGIAVTRALVHAHGAGVIHRDLTAANVHLAEDGAVKVLDFGLAHLFGRDGANDGGTPAYMAPEQWDGDRGGPRTDLFALGVILYQALTGAFPYKVDKGWSEALEPGETPRLPRRTAPARLRRMVRSLLDREPELRPENARAVRDTLLALRRNRDAVVRRRVLGAAVGVATAAVAAAAWIYVQRDAPRGEQVSVVMAATENGAGEASLDAVPGLLSTALEPSPRVKIVPQPRLAYLSRQAGLGDLGHIDAERGRALARIGGAAVTLVPSSWREDGRIALGVRAVESETGRVMFRVNAILPRPRDLATVVDQLSDRIRRELNERAEDRRIRRPVAEMVTASPEAARHYYEGLDCVRKPRTSGLSTSVQCQDWFERALALDPTFPLAHYQLALLNFYLGDSGELARPHLQAALDASGRLPSRESHLVRALAARIDRRTDEAIRIYDQLLAATPEDPAVLLAASDLHGERGDWASAARYLEKLVAVEPDADEPMMSLVDALGRCSRTEDIRALLPRLEADPRHARILVQANVWLGKQVQAVAVARQAVAERGEQELDTLRYALAAAGEFREAEEIARREIARTPEAWRHVASTLTAQGRLTEALRLQPGPSQLSQTSLAQGPFREAIAEAVTWNAHRLWPHAAQAFANDPRYSADLSIVLLLLDDRPHAEQLAQALEPGSPAAVQYQALRKWREGDAVGAAAMLVRAETEDPWPVTGIAPAYLLAEISASLGDDVGTLAAVERFRRLPADRAWRAWAYPRTQLLAATAHARLGDRELAIQELDRLLSLQARADPSVPFPKQARSLRARL
jgi:tetratricopeptide (TPR) repeat protein